MKAVRTAEVRERLRVAAVQCLARPGDLAAAVADHVRWIGAAADSGASVVLFPELSLTGYEPDAIDLHDIRMSTDDAVLQPLSVVCQQRKVHAFVGAPTAGAALPQIGVLHVDTRGSVRVAYAKQHLGVGEIGIFSAGTTGAVVGVNGWKLALSVCRDAGVAEHRTRAAAAGADAYLVGALHVIGTEQRLEEQMSAVARTGMWAVLAQYSGGTGGGPACGQSGIWRPDGTPVVRLGTGPGMALADLDV